MVVLDTNVIIDYLLGKSDVVQVIDTFPINELCMTFVNDLSCSNIKTERNLKNQLKI